VPEQKIAVKNHLLCTYDALTAQCQQQSHC